MEELLCGIALIILVIAFIHIAQPEKTILQLHRQQLKRELRIKSSDVWTLESGEWSEITLSGGEITLILVCDRVICGSVDELCISRHYYNRKGEIIRDQSV